MIRAQWRRLKAWLKEWRGLWRWDRAGRPAPPPHLYKQLVLRRYGRRHGLPTLVETGTYLGDMVAAQSGTFRKIYSIEVAPALAQGARERFAGRPQVEILEGDSGKLLAGLLERAEFKGTPALYWLDGHYSEGITGKGDKDTPIMEELACIAAARRRGDVLLVDDAHCFGVDPGYPSLAELAQTAQRLFPGCAYEVKDNIIRIVTQG